MDQELSAKYNVLFDDLLHHNIGIFLKSRKFKVFLTKQNAIDFWKSLYQKAETNRRFYTIGMDTEKVDSEETFKMLFQYADTESDVQKFITEIIEFFVREKSVFADFSDLEESIDISGFNEDNIEKIKVAIKDFESKNIKRVTPENKKPEIEIENLEKKDSKSIFIVHGHNEAVKQTIARILEKQGLDPIILNEQTDGGLTIIEKLEKYSDVQFAIILLTYDDFGNVKGAEEKNMRARQNVILELGYFFAKLGRKNVLALYEKGVELPSDFNGILYTPIDPEGHWKYKIGKELKAKGFEFDLNSL